MQTIAPSTIPRTVHATPAATTARSELFAPKPVPVIVSIPPPAGETEIGETDALDGEDERVEFKDWTTKEVSKAEKMLQVKQLIEKERWDVLRAADELEREVAAGHVFAGFQDSICNFPPTFKVEKGYELEYNPKRVPSFCDR